MGLLQAGASPQQAPDSPDLPWQEEQKASAPPQWRSRHPVRDAAARTHQGPTCTPRACCVPALGRWPRSLPDPGYKYLPLHPGGICLLQATMATAFLPPLGGHAQPCWVKLGYHIATGCPHGKDHPCLLEVMRTGENSPSACLRMTSFTS